MSLAYYMDVHVPRAITSALIDSGVDVLTAQADGADRMSDPQLLDRASSLDRVVFTRDDDFLREAARRQAEGISFAGIVYAHQLRVTIGQCVGDLCLLAECMDFEELQTRVEHLPLR